MKKFQRNWNLIWPINLNGKYYKIIKKVILKVLNWGSSMVQAPHFHCLLYHYKSHVHILEVFCMLSILQDSRDHGFTQRYHAKSTCGVLFSLCLPVKDFLSAQPCLKLTRFSHSGSAEQTWAHSAALGCFWKMTGLEWAVLLMLTLLPQLCWVCSEL